MRIPIDVRGPVFDALAKIAKKYDLTEREMERAIEWFEFEYPSAEGYADDDEVDFDIDAGEWYQP